jgi:hypothetical protein
VAFTIPVYPTPRLIAYGTKGKAGVIGGSASKQVAVFNATATNNSGGAINVGICRKFNMMAGSGGNFRLWQYVAVGPTYTDVGATVLAGTASTVFTTTNNDGFVFQEKRPFGMLAFTISQAGTGSPVYTYKYWNGASYASLTTLEVPSYAATGDVWVVFQPPSDWVPGGTSVDSDKYSIFVQATTANGTAVKVNAIWAAELVTLYQAVANNAAVQVSFPDSKPFLLEGGEDFIPYFATASSANTASAFYALI